MKAICPSTCSRSITNCNPNVGPVTAVLLQKMNLTIKKNIPSLLFIGPYLEPAWTSLKMLFLKLKVKQLP
jgi:hypothetical protein